MGAELMRGRNRDALAPFPPSLKHMVAAIRETVPQPLQNLKSWVTWESGPAQPDGKFPKLARGRDGTGKSWQAPRQLMTFTEAVDAAFRADHSGIGLRLPIEDVNCEQAFAALDFDGVDVHDDENPRTKEIRRIHERLGRPYAEISPSGRGIRMFVRTRIALPQTSSPNPLGGKDELFCSSTKFVTVTGNHLWGEGVPDATDALLEIAREWNDRKGQRSPATVRSELQAPTLLAHLTAGWCGWPDQKLKDGDGREKMMLAYAGHLRSRGLPQDEIDQLCLQANRDHYEDKLDDDIVLSRSRRYSVLETADVQIAPATTSAPPPKALPTALKPVPTLNPDHLPDVLRDAALDIADRMQCPVDFVAVTMLNAAGAAIGNEVGICPRANDQTWRAFAAIWGGIIAEPGSNKSSAMAEAHRPLTNLEERAHAEYAEACKKYDRELALYERAQADWQKSKAGQIPVAPEKPRPKRFLVHDTTYQKLGEILAGNPRGVLAFNDELTALLLSWDTPGQEAARGFYLQGWSGTGSYSFDRIGRGSIHLSRFCISVFGAFQPDKIKQYAQMAQRGSSHNDGLLQRFQLLVWPDTSREVRIVDRPPNKEAIEKYHQAIYRLAQPGQVLLPSNHPVNARYLLHFSPDAQTLFNDWFLALERSLRSGKYDSSILSHFSKYRSLVPALALLYHLLDSHSGDVCRTCLERGLGMATYLRQHAIRIYSAASGHDHMPSRALAKKLLDGALESGFTARAVLLKGWSDLTNKDAVQGALDSLVEYGWLEEKEVRTGGRPTFRYWPTQGISHELLGLS